MRAAGLASEDIRYVQQLEIDIWGISRTVSGEYFFCPKTHLSYAA